MGNTSTKHQSNQRPKKNVHWKSAETPSPPGKPLLVQTEDSTPDVVTLKWDRPRTDGGSPLYGYLVEHRRTGSPHWVRSTPTLILYPEVALSGLEPGWRYQFRVSAENAVGLSESSELSDPLTVTLQHNAVSPPRFVTDLHDTVAVESDKIEFRVQIAGTPPPQINWFKDGFEVFSSRRTKIINENSTSILIIHQTALTDEGEIKCTATNRAGHVVTKALLKIEAPPKIRLPRQYEDGLLIEADEVIRLKVGLAGRPSPMVVWCHNGEIIKDGERYELETNDKNSMLKINNAKRSDRGEYNLRAINKLGDDNVSFLVTVTDRPSVPGKVQITMSIGKSVTLSWTAPDDDGGCKIGNYVVEYFRIGWNVWLKAVTTRQMTATLNDLIEGSEYKFRVKAESPYGMSDPSEDSDVLFIPDPKRGIHKPTETVDMSSNETDIPPQPSSPTSSVLPPKKRYLSPRRKSSEEKVDKQEQTVKKSITLDVPRSSSKPRVPSPHRLYDSDTIAREMSYGTSDDVVNKQMELKKKLNENNEQLLKEMSYDSSADTYNPRRKVVIKTPNENETNIENVKIGNGNIKYSNQENIIDQHKNNETKPANESKVIKEPENMEISKVGNNQHRNNHDEVHTSNEFVLVLYDNDNEKTENKEEMSYDAEFDSILPPQLSLSTPELGLETPITPAMRRCVSSTELLYEKAMQRFYQAVQLEESEKQQNRRSESVDPQSTKINSRKRLSSFGEGDNISLERRNSLRRKFSDLPEIPVMKNFPNSKEHLNKVNLNETQQVEEIQMKTAIDEEQKLIKESSGLQKEQEEIKETKKYDQEVEEEEYDDMSIEEDRDLKKEILDSQRKISSSKKLSPTSSMEFDEDYTDSTASSNSIGSLDSMEKFKSAIRTIGVEKSDELDTYNPLMSSRTVSASNIKTIDDDIIDTNRKLEKRISFDELTKGIIFGDGSSIQPSDPTTTKEDNTDQMIDYKNEKDNEAEVDQDDEDYDYGEDLDYDEDEEDDHKERIIETPKPRERALSPYRTPEADQSTIPLTKPLPLPDPDFVPKPILKRPTVEQNTSETEKDKKSKTKTKSKKKTGEKTERKSLLNLFKKTPSTGNLAKQKSPEPEPKKNEEKVEQKLSASALAKKKSMERKQSSFEENQVAIDHYGEIVKELSGARKPKVPIYLSSEELKKAAELEAAEKQYNNNINSTNNSSTTIPNSSSSSSSSSTPSASKPITRNDQKTPSPLPPLSPTPSPAPVLNSKENRSIFAIKLSKDTKKHEKKPEIKPLLSDGKTGVDLIKKPEIEIPYVKTELSPPPELPKLIIIKKTTTTENVSIIKPVKCVDVSIDLPDAQTDTTMSPTPPIGSRSRGRSSTRKPSIESDTSSVAKKRTPSVTRSRSNSALRTPTKTTTLNKDQIGGENITPSVSRDPSVTRQRTSSKTRTKSQSKSPSSRNRTKLHVAKIMLDKDYGDDDDSTKRSPTISPEPRTKTPEQLLELHEAKLKVKSTLGYVTDVSMLIVACWVYVFKDPRLVLPILALMVYRQAASAVKNKIPKWMKRKSVDDANEDKNDEE